MLTQKHAHEFYNSLIHTISLSFTHTTHTRRHTHTQKLEATQVPFNRQLDKQIMVHQHKRLLFKNKNK